MMIEIQMNYDVRLEEINKYMQEMKESHVKEITEIKKKMNK